MEKDLQIGKAESISHLALITYKPVTICIEIFSALFVQDECFFFENPCGALVFSVL
jgi:hypothetical protein